MVYQVKDGVISQNYQDYIEEIFTNNFPWYYQSQLAGDDDNTSSFIHMIYHEDKEWKPPLDDSLIYKSLLFPVLLQSLDMPLQKLLRIRAVMNIKNQTGEYIPHTDLDAPHFTMLYYVNDSDGPTKIFEEESVVEIEPKKGRVLFMSGDTLHCGSSPIESDKRILINFNFLLWN